MKKDYPKIPFAVIVKATDGDTESINHVLNHYSNFIDKQSSRPMKDEYGNNVMVVDDSLRGRIKTRLITKVLSFEIQ